MLSIIVAKGKNNIIGKDNKMVWSLPADTERFKDLTKSHTIIMGRKTYETLEKILPDRKYIVFTQNDDFKADNSNVQIVHSMLEIKEYIDSSEENFVIGGAMIYSLLMPYTSKMYVTEINKDFEGDTFFPKINLDVWKETEREKKMPDGDNKYEYDFVTFVKKD